MNRTARNVLNELKWKEQSLKEATIHILDRMHPDKIRTASGADIIHLGKRTFDLQEATIPYYKIIKIEYKGKTIFERGPEP